jgi:serine/threonine-protein kinase RsbW
LPDATIADLKLALTEACSNSVRHAYANGYGHVEISFELQRDRLVIEVSDDGGGFELDESAKDTDAELTEGGLGIAIIRSIADEVELGGGADGRGSTLRFVKLL